MYEVVQSSLHQRLFVITPSNEKVRQTLTNFCPNLTTSNPTQNLEDTIMTNLQQLNEIDITIYPDHMSCWQVHFNSDSAKTFIANLANEWDAECGIDEGHQLSSPLCITPNIVHRFDPAWFEGNLMEALEMEKFTIVNRVIFSDMFPTSSPKTFVPPVVEPRG